MIDNFALAISHGLIMLAVWRLLSRPDLDDDSAPEPVPVEIAAGGKPMRKGAPPRA